MEAHIDPNPAERVRAGLNFFGGFLDAKPSLDPLVPAWLMRLSHAARDGDLATAGACRCPLVVASGARDIGRALDQCELTARQATALGFFAIRGDAADYDRLDAEWRRQAIELHDETLMGWEEIA